MDLQTTDHPDTRASRCLGRHCGLVTNLEFKQGDRQIGDFQTAALVTAALERTLPQDLDESITVTAGGKGTTTTETIVTALGEFLERYSMYWPLDDTTEDTQAGLTATGDAVVDSEALQIWEEPDLHEAGFDVFDVDTTIEWARGKNLLTDEEIFLPTELVSFASTPGESGHFPSTTNGNACGSSLAGALVSSLSEQVERDAIMRTWFEQRSPPRLDISQLDDVAAFKRRIETVDTDITLLDLPTPTDWSVVMAVYVDKRNRKPKFLSCAGAALTRGDAIRDALREMAENIIQTAYRLAGGKQRSDSIDITSTYDFADAVKFYMQPANFDAVKHLLAGQVEPVTEVTKPTYDDPQSRLDAAIDALSIDTTPIAVDLTPDDVRQLGMYTTAVFVPELLEMSLPSMPPSKHPRLGPVETDRGHPFP